MAHEPYRPHGYQNNHFTHDTDGSPPPPPPPSEMPPLPPPRVFKGPAVDSYRLVRSNHDIREYYQQNEFSFNVNDRAPTFPSQEERNRIADNYRPAHRNGPSNRGRGRGRGRGARTMPADRPLLQAQRGDVSQQTLGMAGDPTAPQKFLSTNDATDSDNESMDESHSEDETESRPGLTTHDNDGSNDTVEPPTKRQALARESKEASSVPRWSNPDPYTVLPPVDEEQRKKKDVVKLIRKARIATEKEEATETEVAANDDFISFGFDDDKSGSGGENKDIRSGFSDVPTGPRRANEIQRRHDLHTNGAPGTSTYPTSNVSHMGPPPGLPQASLSGLPPKPVQSLPSKSDGATDQQATYESQDTNLGSRKRTHDDEIKPSVPRPSRRKGKGAPSNGSLERDWIPRRDQDPTPWLAASQYRTENAGFRLHKEICDFYEFVQPRRFEQTVREDILQRLHSAVRHEMPNCDVHCFGSFAAGLYLPNADMDVVVISQSFRDSGIKTACQTNGRMRTLGRNLENSVAERGSVECITGAKVPIIKFVDRVTAIRVDMSFENDTGIIANDTFSFWKRQFPAMPILVTVIKQFLMMRGLNDVATGGLGGFSVTCLVTSLLQNMPRVQTREVIPERHLGEMLLEFLDFYGNQLDISRTGLMMNPPGYFDKVGPFKPCSQLLADNNEIAVSRNRSVYQENRADRLAIIDPNMPSNDISGGSKNVSLIFDRFSKAHQEIMIAMRSHNRLSLLDWMLGGNYENFTWQRDHLRDLYERRWGRVDAELLRQRQTTPEHSHNPARDHESAYENRETAGSSFVSHSVLALADTQIRKPSENNAYTYQRSNNWEPYHTTTTHSMDSPFGENLGNQAKSTSMARSQTLKEQNAPMRVPRNPMRKRKQAQQAQNKANPEALKPRKPRKKNKSNNSKGGMSQKNPITID